MDRSRTRGHVAVLVAVSLVLLLGFAALAIDITRLGLIDGELVALVDNTSMSTMRMIANEAADTEVATLVADAQSYAAGFMAGYPIAGVTLAPLEVEIGTSLEESSGRYASFTPVAADSLYNAIKVTARVSNQEGTGISSSLAHLLGIHWLELSRTSYAVLRPRNIVLCVDGSNSMQYDSQLQRLPEVMILRAANFPDANINAQEVWEAYPKSAPYTGGEGGQPDWGPVWGAFMQAHGYGTPDADINIRYNPRSDPGLLYLPKGASWDSTSADPDAAAQADTLRTFLEGMGYVPEEVNQIMALDDSHWDQRVKVALGLSGWGSGIAGGLWQSQGWPAGVDDAVVTRNELVALAELPLEVSDWDKYVNLVVYDPMHGNVPVDWSAFDFSLPEAPAGDYADFSFTFGVKTLMDYLKNLVTRDSHGHPQLASGFRATQRLEPWTTVRTAISGFMEDFQQTIFNPNDRIALVRYGTDPQVAFLPEMAQSLDSTILSGLQTTGNLSLLQDVLADDIPVHGNTNIAACIADGIAILRDLDAADPAAPNPQPALQEFPCPDDWGCIDGPDGAAVAPSRTAADMIIVLTDGLPKVPKPGVHPEVSTAQAFAQAYAQASEARGRQITVHAICLGVDSDAEFCERLAKGNPDEPPDHAPYFGLDFAPYGSDSVIGNQLEQIFNIFLVLREDALLAFRE